MPFLVVVGVFLWLLYKGHQKYEGLKKENQNLMKEKEDLLKKIISLQEDCIKSSRN